MGLNTMWILPIFVLFPVVAVLSQNSIMDEEILRVLHRAGYKNTSRVARFLTPVLYRDQNAYDAPLEETYDFIIVGAGSAGTVLANRLSENPAWKVLLLEIGSEPTAITEIPVLAPLFQFTDLNWNYLMEKQDNMCLGLVDQRMAWPRGRALGGTSAINYMIHTRGNRLDYDRWAAMDNPGWSYKDVLPYFLKSEDAQLSRGDPDYHRRGGYLSVEDVRFRFPVVQTFVQAALEAGHKFVDYNGKNQIGVSYVQSTTRQGKRCSGEKAFLRPARDRKNLRILTKSRAVKLLIDPDTRKAYGVVYVKNRQYRKALASNEIVLSAGAFNSPQLLMLSGIGPRDHLEELGVPLVQDLPVGQKMYDHLCFLGLTFTLNQSISGDQRLLYDPNSLLNFLLRGTGPLVSLGGVESLLYFKTNVTKEPADYPDMELIFISGGMSTDDGQFYRKTFRITDEIYNTVWKPTEGQPTFTVLPMLVHPKSYGYLRLKSRNPYHWPKFYGNYFTDPDNADIRAFIVAIREVQRISRMQAFQRYGIQQIKTPIPGCTHRVFDTDDYWECALRHISATLHHQVATCKMGPRHDPEAVVDNKLRVYGIKNLRVADTSIIPLPLTAHTNVPAYMVGEKAADLIKEDWTNAFSPKIDERFS